MNSSYSIMSKLNYTSFVKRDNDELARLESERRSGRHLSSRADLLRQRILKEERERDIGFWLPDMADIRNVELLRGWNGEWTSLKTLEYIRLSKSGVKHKSSFPPKGKS